MCPNCRASSDIRLQARSLLLPRVKRYVLASEHCWVGGMLQRFAFMMAAGVAPCKIFTMGSLDEVYLMNKQILCPRCMIMILSPTVPNCSPFAVN